MLPLFKNISPHIAEAIHAQIVILRDAGIGCLSSALICVALRTYVRTRLLKAFGWDDFVMLICLVGQKCIIAARRLANYPKDQLHPSGRFPSICDS